MNIQKEVEKYQAKRSKLAQELVYKISNFIGDKMKANDRIIKTQEALDAEAKANHKAIEEAENAIDSIKY